MLDKSNYIQDDDFLYGLLDWKVNYTEEWKDKVLKRFPPPIVSEQEEQLNIDEIEVGKNISIPIILNSAEIERSDNNPNKPWLKLEMQNSHGTFRGKMWDNNGSVTEVYERVKDGGVFLAKGKVTQFPKETGQKTLTVNSFVEINDIEPNALIPMTTYDVEELTLEFFSYVERLDSNHQELILSTMDEYWSIFSISPAAKFFHHEFLVGLLQHTVEMIRIIVNLNNIDPSPATALFKLVNKIKNECFTISIENIRKDNPKKHKNLPWSGKGDHLMEVVHAIGEKSKTHTINTSLLIVGTVFHDIGKVYEYSRAHETNKYKLLYPYASDIDDYQEICATRKTGVAMDEYGLKVGHMALGVKMLQKVLSQHEISLSLNEIVDIEHMIMAHHYSKDMGSPINPSTLEALVLHFVDIIDANYTIQKKSII